MGELASRLRCLADIAQEAPDGWTRLNSSARELTRDASREIERLEKIADAGMAVIASLAAAISLLERTPKARKAAASDRIFEQMLADYRKALDAGRAALATKENEDG